MFVGAHKQAFRDGQLRFEGDLTRLAQPKIFAARPVPKGLDRLLKPLFGGPQFRLQYLGRYTRRVAISNHRLTSFAEGKVTFVGATPLRQRTQVDDSVAVARGVLTPLSVARAPQRLRARPSLPTIRSPRS